MKGQRNIIDAYIENRIEQEWWVFDSKRKQFSFTERDLFKQSVRTILRNCEPPDEDPADD